jgi:hypothetical protein
MKRVFAVVALGLSLSGCAAFDPYYDYGYYYGGGGGYYGGPDGRHARVRKCYEVRDYYGAPYLECRYVKREQPRRKYRDDYYYD